LLSSLTTNGKDTALAEQILGNMSAMLQVLVQ
jgi:hypothetical protein